MTDKDSPAVKKQTGPAVKKTNRGFALKSSLAIVSKNAHDVDDNLQIYFFGESEFAPNFCLFQS